jgi:hypothetical protein
VRTILRIAVMAVGVVALVEYSEATPDESTLTASAPEVKVAGSSALTSLSPTTVTTMTTTGPVTTTTAVSSGGGR